MVAFQMTTLTGQVLYEQDFENGVTGMILLDVDKKISASMNTFKSATWAVRDIAGDKYATSNSWFTVVAAANDYMITPIIKGTTTSTFVTWTAFSSDPQFRDKYEVRVSLGGDKPADFTKVIYTNEEEESLPTDRGVSLAEFAGKDIRIAFRNVSVDKFLLNIDDIKVSDLTELNVSLVDANIKKYILKGKSEPINFTVKNNGSKAITEMVIEWTDGPDKYTDNLTGLNIEPFTNYSADFTNLFKAEDGTVSNLTAKIISVNGGVNTNINVTKSLEVHGALQNVQRKMMVEEATGTWCTWCPRGAVNMEKMRKNYDSEFIGIAVHNGDPMANAEYDGGLTNLDGFGGFPSVVINRERIEDPADMESILKDDIRNNIAPAIVELETQVFGRKIEAQATITFNTDFSGKDTLRYITVLVEDGVTGTAAGYAQVNSYANGAQGPMGGYELLPNPVPANKMVYNEVGRELINGFKGKEITGADIKAGDELNLLFDIEVDPKYKIENVFVVMMVADGDGAIIGAEHAFAKTTAVNNINEVATDINIAPNPTTGVSYLTVNIKESADVNVSIMNQLGQVIGKRNYGKLAGNQVLPINAQDFNKGLYLVQMTVGDKQITKKLMVD
jgi:hypothetical protein